MGRGGIRDSGSDGSSGRGSGKELVALVPPCDIGDKRAIWGAPRLSLRCKVTALIVVTGGYEHRLRRQRVPSPTRLPDIAGLAKPPKHHLHVVRRSPQPLRQLRRGEWLARVVQGSEDGGAALAELGGVGVVRHLPAARGAALQSRA